MSDDTKKDSEQEVDDQETKEAEGGDKQGSTGTAAPADDDIIIK
jgi:hypothetical protein